MKSIPVAIFAGLLIFVMPINAQDKYDTKPHRAAWMEGQWGVRFLLPGGDREELKTFDVSQCMAQLEQLDTMSWIMLNVTQGACGSLYTAPNPILEKHIHPAMAPQRDLLGEMLDEADKAGLKVLVYFASEGPAKVKSWTHHLEKLVPGSFETWEKYCKSESMTSKEAIAKIIIKYYSERYGTKIAGWWFDHAEFSDTKLYAEAARAGNTDAVISFNMHHEGQVARGAEQENIAFGHPIQLIKKPPDCNGNIAMIETIENGPYVDGVLGHIFMPMQRLWWGKEASFTTEKAVRWTQRVTRANGAYTWAVALGSSAERSSNLAAKQFEQLLKINEAIRQDRLKKDPRPKKKNQSSRI